MTTQASRRRLIGSPPQPRRTLARAAVRVGADHFRPVLRSDCLAAYNCEPTWGRPTVSPVEGHHT